MTSKWLKEHKEIHEENFSKKDFLDVLNCLGKFENDMKKWVKEGETHKKKGKEKKDVLKVETEKLRH